MATGKVNVGGGLIPGDIVTYEDIGVLPPLDLWSYRISYPQRVDASVEGFYSIEEGTKHTRLTKLNLDGTLAWSSYHSAYEGYGLAVSRQENKIYVQRPNFLLCFNPDGTVERQLSSNGAGEIAICPDGNVVVLRDLATGSISKMNYLTGAVIWNVNTLPRPTCVTVDDNGDITIGFINGWVTKYDQDGTLIWSTRIDTITSTVLSVCNGPNQTIYSVSGNRVYKYDSQGVIIWSSQNTYSSTTSIVVDREGDIHVGGARCVKLNPAGDIIYSSKEIYNIKRMVLDPFNNMFVNTNIEYNYLRNVLNNGFIIK